MSGVAESTLRRFALVSTATVSTQLFRRGLRNTHLPGLRPVGGASRRMVGEAFTLRYIPAREDLDTLDVFVDYDHPQRLAVESAPPGSVLVMDCRGRTAAASLGSILATRLHRRGVAGLVTDGTVRDAAGIAGLDLPVFAAGASPTTNLARHHAVDLQVPIGCAEVAVYPGDVLVGDADGVVCVPRDIATEVAEAAVAQERLEDFILETIESGEPLRGNYPPDAAALARYERWRR
jgi:regulator of RNase E activity RraA